MADTAIPRSMDSFGSDDMAMPELKLIQNVGGDDAKTAGAKPGDLYCSLTGDIFKGEEGFKIVIVDVKKQRTYWGRTEILDEPPECASLDGVASIYGKDCKGCEFYTDTPWAIDPGERRKFCTLRYNMIAVNFETGLPLLIRTTGNSAKAVRELISSLRFNKLLKGEIHRAIIRVNTQKKKSISGDSYAYKFTPAGIISEAEKAKEMETLTIQLIGTQVALPEGQEEETPGPAEQMAETKAEPEPTGENKFVKKPVSAVTAAKPAEVKKPDAIDMDI